MTLDARSKERLEALGRTLPKKLPPPEPPAAPRGTGAPVDRAMDPRDKRASAPRREIPQRLPPGARRPPAETPRHPLERAQEPAELFRALIAASADGTVPPHLLDRLRELEASLRPDATGLSSGRALGRGSIPEASGTTANDRPTGRGGKGAAGRRRDSRNPGRANDDQDLYAAFAQLLLEDDAD
jgi:hypothetical protein